MPDVDFTAEVETLISYFGHNYQQSAYAARNEDAKAYKSAFTAKRASYIFLQRCNVDPNSAGWLFVIGSD